MNNNDLNDLRKEINLIDDEIMPLLEKRMEVSTKIKNVKKAKSILITDKTRENDILNKCANYKHENSIKSIYKSIFTESKLIQEKKENNSCLLGLSLPYTYSKDIHKYFHNDSYDIIETTNPTEYIKKYKNLSVTTPYKNICFKYALENEFIIDSNAKETEVINCITKDSGSKGYNLDKQAFLNELLHYNIDIKDKNVLILGNGATAKSVYAAVISLHPKSIIVAARNIRNNEILIENIYQENITDTINIIINTTSYGVFPNIEIKPIVYLDKFSNLEAVVDVNYNPIRSSLLIEAKKHNIKSYNGLYMLVENGRLSEELWQNKSFSESLTNNYVRELTIKYTNIILIGMPYSGKTTLAKELSIIMNKNCIDTDLSLSQKNISIKQLGIEEFRKSETELAEHLSTIMPGFIISTGGGWIENRFNIDYLKQNGIVVFIDTPLEILNKHIDDSRPLADNKDKLKNLYMQRHQLYKNAADIVVPINHDTPIYINALKIMEKIYEYYDN